MRHYTFSYSFVVLCVQNSKKHAHVFKMEQSVKKVLWQIFFSTFFFFLQTSHIQFPRSFLFTPRPDSHRLRLVSPVPPRTTPAALPLSYRTEIQEVAEFLVSSHCSHSLLLFVHNLQSLINPTREICRYRTLMALASKEIYMELVSNKKNSRGKLNNMIFFKNVPILNI